MTVKLLNQKEAVRRLRGLGSVMKVVGVEFDHGDIAIVGPKLPAGAIPIEMLLHIVTAWNSGTSDTGVVGDAGSANRYFTAIDMQATAGTFFRLSTQATTGKDGYQPATALPILIAITKVGTTSTAGKGRLYVAYFVPRKE